jgi:hypothetical protein
VSFRRAEVALLGRVLTLRGRVHVLSARVRVLSARLFLLRRWRRVLPEWRHRLLEKRRVLPERRCLLSEWRCLLSEWRCLLSERRRLLVSVTFEPRAPSRRARRCWTALRIDSTAAVDRAETQLRREHRAENRDRASIMHYRFVLLSHR